MSFSSHKKLAIQYILNDEAKQNPASSHDQHRQKQRLADSASTTSPFQSAPKSIINTPLSVKDLRHHRSQIGASSSHDQSKILGPADSHPTMPLPERGKKLMKSFECELCFQTFTERGNLNKHISSVHLKEKNKVCTEPGCGKRFAFRDGLIRHVTLVHNNERNYKCTKCDKRFKQASHLAKHTRTVHKQ